MPISNFSDPAYFCDIPEPKNQSTKFAYNFYEENELPEPGSQTSYGIIEVNGVVDNGSLLQIPRYIHISWEYESLSDRLDDREFLTIFSKDNVSKIIEEGIVPVGTRFNSVNFLKFSAENKIANLVSAIKSQDPELKDLRFLNPDERILSVDLNNIPKEPNSTINSDLLFDTKSNLNFVLSESVFSNLINETKSDIFSQFNEGYQSFSTPFSTTEEDDFLRNRSLGTSMAYFDPQLVGFLITKYKVLDSGNLIKVSDFIVKDTNIKSYVDKKVFYGVTYSYEIRAVWLFHVPFVLGNTFEFEKILFSSKPSISFIKCEDKTAPPPPTEIRFLFDKKDEGLFISWNLPVNKQGDIKRVQIFRRKLIDHPFEIIGEIRFNERSSPPSVQYEKIPLNDIYIQEDKNLPDKFFIDKEFGIKSKFIYCLASIDAHGFSSNLSSQFEVYFDKTKNKLIKSVISLGGAPKPYPNFYIEDENLFEPFLKRSGKNFQKIHMIFTPEYSKLLRHVSGSVDLIVDEIKDNKEYKLQIINLDNQKSQNFNFRINSN
jgi:hypothetical protein